MITAEEHCRANIIVCCNQIKMIHHAVQRLGVYTVHQYTIIAESLLDKTCLVIFKTPEPKIRSFQAESKFSLCIKNNLLCQNVRLKVDIFSSGEIVENFKIC